MKIMEFDEELQPEEKEIVAYGLQQLKVNCICIGTILLASIACGMVLQGIVFLFAFIPLRLYSGGYHANSRKMCAVISFCSVLLCFILIKICMYSSLFWFLLSTASLLIIGILSPVSNDVKVLEKEEQRVYKHRTRKIAFVIYVVMQIACLFGLKLVVCSFGAAFLLVDVSLISGYIKYKV